MTAICHGNYKGVSKVSHNECNHTVENKEVFSFYYFGLKSM